MYAYLIYIGGAQNVTRMCMCIEFLNQVFTQENAHVVSCFGMVIRPKCSPSLEVFWALIDQVNSERIFRSLCLPRLSTQAMRMGDVIRP